MSILIGVLMFAVTLVSCVGCASIAQHPHKIIRTTTGDVIKKQNTFFPIQSFVMTRQSFKITSNICDEAGNCIDHVIGNSSGTASGVIVKTSTENSYILTAGHVCVPPPPTTSIPGKVRITYSISLITGFGRESKAEVEAIDLENDLCLLSSKSYLGPGLAIQDFETRLHSKVYNMASPSGLAAPVAVPVFDGYYIGRVMNRILFTIPAAPGSSGSPIMNERNEIITIVSAAAIRFDEFAICPTTDSVRKFLLANLPVKKKEGLIDKIKSKL